MSLFGSSSNTQPSSNIFGGPLKSGLFDAPAQT